jgi:tetratricopeptide (TPR) repeat protein
MLRWLLATRRRALLTLAAFAVAIIGGGAAVTLTVWPGKRPAYIRQLAKAFARYDAGDARGARELAAALLANPEADFEDQGGAYYILGAITLAEADLQISPEKRRLLLLVAARYLDEARIRGVPQTRASHARFSLCQALHGSGRYARCVPLLREALEAEANPDPRLHELLADSLFQLRPPRLAEALAHHQQYLQLAGARLSPRERDAAQLAECRILLAQGQYGAAAAAAERIARNSPLRGEAVVMRGRALLAHPEADAARREALLAELDQFVGEASNPSIAAGVNLLIGMLWQQQGDERAARTRFDRVRREFFLLPEGLAATVLMADLVRAQQPQLAASLYQRAIAQAGSPATYKNDWLPIEEFQNRVEQTIDDLAARQEFSLARDLAGSLPPFFPVTTVLQRQASIDRAWAMQLEQQAQREALTKAELTLADARQHWRQAGVLGRQLAAQRIATRFYSDDLARAADDLRRGQGYEQAVAVYRDLLAQGPRQGEPDALVGSGESLLALGRVDEALSALDRCLQSYPTHPMAYRARLLASQAHQEKSALPAAKELLVDNLYRYSLAPQSAEWRDSQFALGGLYYREGLALEAKSRQAGVDRADPDNRKDGLLLLEQSYAAFEEAVRTLGEAVLRYPTLHQATIARYCIAEAHRHSAKWPRKRLPTVSIETSRAALVRQMQEHLQSAVAEYSGLITRLSEQPDSSRSPTEGAILRNSYFGRADALFDRGNFDEAIQAYSAATNRYQHEPESLEAYVQIATCYRRMGRASEARSTLEQARIVLARIRPDADFTRTTRLSRQDWSQLLDWLRTL